MSDAYSNFTIHTVVEGVYAAIPNGGSNAGIIDLGDRTIIFDTFTTIGAAIELKAAAERLTGRAPSLVINSHAHADHYQGNAVFADEAVIISSTNTRQAIADEGLVRLERMKRSMMEQANALRTRLVQSVDVDERRQLQAVLQEYDDFFADYPEPEDLRVPVVTFDSSITFHGTERSAVLVTYGGAHSPCDAVLWLPEENILFAADLIIPNDNLILNQGTPENWAPILDKLEALQPRTIVPGHGPIVSAHEGFKWARFYLDYVNHIIEDMNSDDNLEELSLPGNCRRNGFIQNIRFLLDRKHS